MKFASRKLEWLMIYIGHYVSMIFTSEALELVQTGP